MIIYGKGFVMHGNETMYPEFICDSIMHQGFLEQNFVGFFGLFIINTCDLR
jgi:hypothetical protein